MTLIICILLGLCLGQFIKVTPDPALLEFFRRAWSWLMGIDLIGTIDRLRMGPLQRKVAAAFMQLEAEVELGKSAEISPGKPIASGSKTKGVSADGTPAA